MYGVKYQIEVDEKIVDGFLVDFVELNKIARNNYKGLIYLMNVMDDNTTNYYMWLKNDNDNINYFVKI